MTKQYEKIGKFEFIEGHTKSCRQYQKERDIEFNDDGKQCACKYLQTHLLQKKAKREAKV